MNDHQLSLNATPQEVNDYLKLWLAAGGNIMELPIIQKILDEQKDNSISRQ